jgi:hypothetical protein
MVRVVPGRQIIGTYGGLDGLYIRLLFYRRGQKRKDQLQGSRLPLRECRFLGFDGQLSSLGFVAFAHSSSIKHIPLRACKERSSISHRVGLQRNEKRPIEEIAINTCFSITRHLLQRLRSPGW